MCNRILHVLVAISVLLASPWHQVVATAECPQANLVQPNSYASLDRPVMLLGAVSNHNGSITYMLENIGSAGITLSSLRYPRGILKSIALVTMISSSSEAEKVTMATGQYDGEEALFLFYKNALWQLDFATSAWQRVSGTTGVKPSSADLNTSATAATAKFGAQAGIAVGGDKVFIADGENGCLRVLANNMIWNVAGWCGQQDQRDAANSLLQTPSLVTLQQGELGSTTLLIGDRGSSGSGTQWLSMTYGVPTSLAKMSLEAAVDSSSSNTDDTLEDVVEATIAHMQVLDAFAHPLITKYMSPVPPQLLYGVSEDLPCTLVVVKPATKSKVLLLTTQKACGVAKPRGVINTNKVIYDVLDNREPLSFSGACVGKVPPAGEQRVGEERLILIALVTVTILVVIVVVAAIIRFKMTKPADHHEVDRAAVAEVEEAERNNRTIAAMVGMSEHGGSDIAFGLRPTTNGSAPTTTRGAHSNGSNQSKQGDDAAVVVATGEDDDEPIHTKDVSTYQKMKLIGRGGNGSVYSAMLGDGSIVAMKEMLMSPGDEDSLISLQHEVTLLSSLRHPYVVEYYDSRYEKEEMRFLLFMELISSGTLSATVRNLRDYIKEDVAKIYVRQIVEGLAHVHSKGIVHRDIKCDNVLLTQQGVCKLADFGASKAIGNTAGASRAANTMIGTPHFMAPEVLMGSISDSDDTVGYGKKADVWSLGIMCLELLNKGEMPWPKFASQGVAFVHISSPEGKPIIPSFLSPCCQDFIKQCCNRNPNKRPTCEELLLHEWIAYVQLPRSRSKRGGGGGASANNSANPVANSSVSHSDVMLNDV